MLKDQILGGFPERVPLQIEAVEQEGNVSYRITTEAGIRASALGGRPELSTGRHGAYP